MMKFLLVFIIFIFLFHAESDAIGRKRKYNGPPRTEAELMNKVMECLHNKDTVSYFYMFPPFDTLWNMVMHNPDPNPEIVKELNKLREHPTVLIDLDPFYNHAIIGRFVETLKKGEDSGIQWKGIIMQRYELQKQPLTRGMEGLQMIVPERFRGYMFVRDMLTSTTYCVTLMEIQKINGVFCGGQVLNVLEADNIDEYIRKENYERNYLEHQAQLAAQSRIDSVRADSLKDAGGGVKRDTTLPDSLKAGTSVSTVQEPPKDSVKSKKDLLLSPAPPDDEANRTRREVVDRKYYRGKFDEEIPVELYVRYMKDHQDKVTKYWDALYKFGDMSEYVKLDVSMTPEAKWLFEEPVASMELELAGKNYTGSWTNGDNQTGYDAELVQKDLSQKKIEELDFILENGTWGKTNEQKIKEKEEDGDKKDKNKDDKKESKRRRNRDDKRQDDSKEKKEVPKDDKKDGDKPPPDKTENDKKENDKKENDKKDNDTGKEDKKDSDD
ncbi:MAG: hypothetical protein H7257_04060 [Taibaiella sp.]|nr:hypothetical protein [Taibaiella sp.]